MQNHKPKLNKILFSSAICTTIGMSMPLTASADDVPDYMKIITLNDGTATPKDKIAIKNVYALNEGMFPIYDNSIAIYKKHLKERVPLIMGLFSGDGGRFILYQPGKDPQEAPPPPKVYKIAKSVGHCAMATYDLVAPYCTSSSTDQAWLGEMKAYRTRVQTAIEALDQIDDLKPEDRDLMKDTLKNHVLVFMDKCVAKGSFNFADVIEYTHGVKPKLVKLIGVASSYQVAHWYGVLEKWKAQLGPDWDKTYALSNTIYVARQNNILFSVLAQFMGEKAMNDRLLLLETTDFTATPDDMMVEFLRIISDRALGMSFYNDYHMMDYELLGSGGRHAIEAEAAKRGQKAILPPLVPFDSTQWPMRIDTKSGTAATSLEDIK